jgi:prevent-host-death family protein
LEVVMQTVSLFDAKTHLSRLVEQIVSGVEDEIVISRNGKPVARVVPIQTDTSRRVGLARGEFDVPDDIDRHNAEVAALFLGDR